MYVMGNINVSYLRLINGLYLITLIVVSSPVIPLQHQLCGQGEGPTPPQSLAEASSCWRWCRGQRAALCGGWWALEPQPVCREKSADQSLTLPALCPRGAALPATRMLSASPRTCQQSRRLQRQGH